MNIFVSWSGPRSEHIATTFRWWLPNVLQSVTPFISKQDIRKGDRGGEVIADNLEAANVGIICLTPENLKAPWILFEAGALSKIKSAHVCTFLYELKPSEVAPPLGQFQHTGNSKGEVRALIDTINSRLPKGLDVVRLDESFEIWWPKFEAKLAETPKIPAEEVPEKRTEQSKFDEILELLREQQAPLVSISPELKPVPSNHTLRRGFTQPQINAALAVLKIGPAPRNQIQFALGNFLCDRGYAFISTRNDEEVLVITPEGEQRLEN